MDLGRISGMYPVHWSCHDADGNVVTTISRLYDCGPDESKEAIMEKAKQAMVCIQGRITRMMDYTYTTLPDPKRRGHLYPIAVVYIFGIKCLTNALCGISGAQVREIKAHFTEMINGRIRTEIINDEHPVWDLRAPTAAGAAGAVGHYGQLVSNGGDEPIYAFSIEEYIRNNVPSQISALKDVLVKDPAPMITNRSIPDFFEFFGFTGYSHDKFVLVPDAVVGDGEIIVVGGAGAAEPVRRRHGPSAHVKVDAAAAAALLKAAVEASDKKDDDLMMDIRQSYLEDRELKRRYVTFVANLPPADIIRIIKGQLSIHMRREDGNIIFIPISIDEGKIPTPLNFELDEHYAIITAIIEKVTNITPSCIFPYLKVISCLNYDSYKNNVVPTIMLTLMSYITNHIRRKKGVSSATTTNNSEREVTQIFLRIQKRFEYVFSLYVDKFKLGYTTEQMADSLETIGHIAKYNGSSTLVKFDFVNPFYIACMIHNTVLQLKTFKEFVMTVAWSHNDASKEHFARHGASITKATDPAVNEEMDSLYISVAMTFLMVGLPRVSKIQYIAGLRFVQTDFTDADYELLDAGCSGVPAGAGAGAAAALAPAGGAGRGHNSNNNNNELDGVVAGRKTGKKGKTGTRKGGKKRVGGAVYGRQSTRKFARRRNA
jgi:hypothetical protein